MLSSAISASIIRLLAASKPIDLVVRKSDAKPRDESFPPLCARRLAILVIAPLIEISPPAAVALIVTAADELAAAKLDTAATISRLLMVIFEPVDLESRYTSVEVMNPS